MPAGGDARPPADAARLEPVQELGDFTATPRVIWITALAVAIGAVSACIALALLRLIGRLALPGRNKRPAA